MKPAQVFGFLEAARAWGSASVAFEGGEPFLRYNLLLQAIRQASSLGMKTAAVTNAFWAFSRKRARALLAPLSEAGLGSLMISTDDFHGEEEENRRARLALDTAGEMGLEAFLAQTETEGVMFRGRAAEVLAPDHPGVDPNTLTRCPYEDLGEPGRIHVDAWGYLHLCQGLALGRAHEPRDLQGLLEEYRAYRHPIVRHIVEGGPLQLARAFDISLAETYADACHLCYRARESLRGRFPDLLGPGPVYGVY